MTTDIRTDFNVPTTNFARIAAEVTRLNRKATKIGVAPVVLTVTGTSIAQYVVDSHGYHARLNEGADIAALRKDGKVVRGIEFTAFTLEGEGPRLNGWQFAASIDSDTSVIRKVETFDGDIPVEFRNADQTRCDHCHTARRRNDVFILTHEDGRWVQVGRQCLKDFLGYNNPQAVAAWLEHLSALVRGAGDEDGFDFGGGGASYESVEDYLANVIAIIRTEGWLSRSEAYNRGDTGQSTASRALDNIYNYGKRDSKGTKLWVDTDENDVAEAQAVVEWVLSTYGDRSDLNDFEYNLFASIRAGYVKSKTVGIAAYAVVAYRKAIEAEIERKRRAEADADKSNDWIGEVGKRSEFDLTVTSVQHLEGNYGVTVLHAFEDAAGNSVKWFASSGQGLVAGDTVKLVGSVKKHDEYKGRKQTVITRCKVAALA